MKLTPAHIPKEPNAKLPVKYEAAVVALRECDQIDECKHWKDKAIALCSYARQARDDEMEKTAHRIKLRAERRCGELLLEIEKGKTGPKLRDGADPQLNRKTAAEQAGLSERQRKNAIRLARIPKKDFEAQVESDNPPATVSLIEQGMLKGIPAYKQLNLTEAEFRAGMYIPGSIDTHREEISEHKPEDVVKGFLRIHRESRHAELLKNLNTIAAYHEELRRQLSYEDKTIETSSP